MPLVPSVCSRNVAWWSRPQVQSFGSPRAARRSAPVASRAAAITSGAGLLPPGRRDVVPPRRSRVVEEARSAPATMRRHRRTRGRAARARRRRGRAAGGTRSPGRRPPRCSPTARLAVPVLDAVEHRPTVGGGGRDALEVRLDEIRPEDPGVHLDGRASPRSSRRSADILEQRDDPLRPVARIPLRRDEVRVLCRRPRRCSR